MDWKDKIRKRRLLLSSILGKASAINKLDISEDSAAKDFYTF